MSREVPQDWLETEIGEIAEIQIGGTPSRAVPSYWAQNEEEGLPWLSIADMRAPEIFRTKERITASGAKNSNAKLIKPDTVLMSFKLSIGKIAIARVPLYTNEAIAAFIPDPTKLENSFLRYALPHFVGYVETDQAVKGVTLNKAKLKSLVLPLPPLYEQRRIAEILSSVDEAIATTRAMIEQTRKVKQGVLERLLTKGIGHKRFKQTEIGKIPEEWEVVNLFDVLREPARNGYSPVSPPLPTGGWLLSLGSLSNDGLTGENLKPAPLDDTRMGAAKLSYGDVLISRSNTPERVGMVGIYKGQPPNCFFPDLMICLRFSEGLINADFGALWLRHLQATGYFKRAAAGTSASMVKINRGLLSRIRIAVPSIGEQKTIVNKINEIHLTIGAAEDQLRAAVSMKAALVSDLLTGRKRVTDALPMAAE